MPRKKKETESTNKTKKKTVKKTAKTKKSKSSKTNKSDNKSNDKPEVNIGLIGHVDHGKTTLTKRLSGKWTDTHSEELKRGITIKLGYANATFYKCKKCKEYGISPTCKCGGKAEKTRTVSFVDAPGHESLMATMISGATIMDGAILMIAANERVPQPQTKEHMLALNIMGIKNIVVVQNKIDTVSKEEAEKNYEHIKKFLKGSMYENAPIIPISAQHDININYVIEAIEETIKTPKRDLKADPLMLSARSFDINKPGSNPIEMKGGIIGGAVKQGKIKVGDEIEIRPGVRRNDSYVSLFAKVNAIMSDKTKIDEATPGGSVALMTTLDPALTKSDNVVGSVIGHKDELPPVWNKLKLDIHLLKRVVGSEHPIEVEDLKPNEMLMMNINSAATVGVVKHIGSKSVDCDLKIPVCAWEGEKITIARRFGAKWRLIGYGIILKSEKK